jgi:uncharacterized protein with NRDE domain
MCLIVFSLHHHPGYRLILAANRDEFYDRPTLALSRWDDLPDISAGRDVKGGGTWLGVSRSGRIAAITNYRDPASVIADAPSRGLLVSGFLSSTESPESYLRQLGQSDRRYNGFNLIAGDRTGLWYVSNRSSGVRKLEPGLYGLSNHLLDTPWPKVRNAKAAMSRLLKPGGPPDVERLFEVLRDRTVAPDTDLPDTGVGLEMESMLSPIFITSADYGTRSSSVLTIDDAGAVIFWERTYDFDSTGQLVSDTRCVEFVIV